MFLPFFHSCSQLAVGSATAEETMPKDAPNTPATPTPSATRRRWTVQALEGSAQPAVTVVTCGDATAKAAAKAKGKAGAKAKAKAAAKETKAEPGLG